MRRIIGPGQGEVLGPERGARDRFLVDAKDWGGGLAVVEHLLAPRCIAGPLHRHTREDEFSYVLEGRVWYRFGDEDVVAHTGDLVIKPRFEWHTFWNAADEPARVLELITPGGLEEAFRVMDTDPDVDIVALAAEYGAEVDLAGTEPIVEQYGLTWG
jgi:quercetin dioxygenase-like cupin family protein